MVFCPHTVSQDNRTTCFLTDEAEHVISGRMSNKSLETEPVLLIRQRLCSVELVGSTQGVTDLGLFELDGKVLHKIHNTLETQLIANSPIPVL